MRALAIRLAVVAAGHRNRPSSTRPCSYLRFPTFIIMSPTRGEVVVAQRPSHAGHRCPHKRGGSSARQVRVVDGGQRACQRRPWTRRRSTARRPLTIDAQIPRHFFRFAEAEPCAPCVTAKHAYCPRSLQIRYILDCLYKRNSISTGINIRPHLRLNTRGALVGLQGDQQPLA